MARKRLTDGKGSSITGMLKEHPSLGRLKHVNITTCSSGLGHNLLQQTPF